MIAPEKCPKCRDPLKDGWDNVYQCGSAFYTKGPMAGKFEERQWCVRRQRDQLAERVKRLEEAGRALAKRHLLVVVTYPQAQADVAEYEKAIQ